MKHILFLAVFALAPLAANATERTGTTSFGGIQVKVSVDAAKSTFQIGESKFKSDVIMNGDNLTMTGTKRVGIMTSEETLTATIFLNGGDGGNIEGFKEYPCKDVRITIVRVKDDGTRTIIKNECAFLSP